MSAASPAHPRPVLYLATITTTTTQPGDPIMTRRSTLLMALAVLIAFGTVAPLAAMPNDPATERDVVVYLRDLASVAETRTVTLEKGEHSIDLTSILPHILAGSATIEARGVDTRGLQVIDNLFDLDKYWASRVGEMVAVNDGDTTRSGILRRATGSHLFLDIDGALVPVSRSAADKDLSIDMIPAGLVTEPTLRWQYDAKKAGDVTLRLSYLAEGLTWEGRHRLDVDGSSATVTPGFTVTNSSGVVLPYSSLTLAAGEIHLAGDRRRVDRMNPKPGAASDSKTEQLGDLRTWKMEGAGMLTLGETTMQPMGAVEASGVERSYVYDATIFDDRAMTRLGFTLPRSLPSGTVRVYDHKKGDVLFTGEDAIDDTPAGSPFELTLGQVFDLTAERTRMEETRNDEGTRQTFKVVLGNSGANKVSIRVLERLFGDWSITSATLDGNSVDAQRVDARTARFDVPVPAGKTVTLTYEIRYAR